MDSDVVKSMAVEMKVGGKAPAINHNSLTTKLIEKGVPPSLVVRTYYVNGPAHDGVQSVTVYYVEG